MKRGDRYRLRTKTQNHDLTVRRVAKDGSWAVVFTYDNRTLTSETRRVPLPLPDGWVPAKSGQ